MMWTRHPTLQTFTTQAFHCHFYTKHRPHHPATAHRFFKLPLFRFVSSQTTSTSATSSLGKTSLAGTLVLLLGLSSDPFLSFIENNTQNDNVSYWKMRSHASRKDNHLDTKTNDNNRKCHLRSSQHNDKSGSIVPKYSRIVIVGGGMAGLHTALCLAERSAFKNQEKRRWRDIIVGGSPKKYMAENKERECVEIIVMEKDEIGDGASGRAKGLVVPGFQVPLSNLRQNAHDSPHPNSYNVPSIVRSIQSLVGRPDTTPRYSVAVVNELYDATYVALNRLRDIVQRYKIDCDWVECGVVEGSIHNVDEAEEENSDVNEEEDGCQILTAKQVNQIMGRRDDKADDNNNAQNNLYPWGEYDPNCAGVDPHALTLGLANAVEQWGVKIYEHATIRHLEKIDSKLESTTNKGRYALTTKEGHIIHCDHVVLCTGAESGLSKRLSNSIIPIYTWMAATEPLYDDCPLQMEAANKVLVELEDGNRDNKIRRPPTSLTGAPMCGDDHFALNYWRNNNQKDARLLFGSLCDTYPMPVSFISWRLRNALSEVYPHLSKVIFDHVWGGKLAVALNAMPIIGRDVDFDDIPNENRNNVDVTSGGVWINTGYSGHGIVPTALGGSVIANAILGIPDRDDSDINVKEKQLWQLFHTYFPPSAWNGYPFSRVGAGTVFLVYNLFDYLEKKGVPVPRLPEIW